MLFVGFGFLAVFSIGMPFLATGIALLALAPFRGRPAVFWPWLLGVVAFFVGYVLVAPLTCSAQSTRTASAPSSEGPAAVETSDGSVTCTNPLGIRYAGGPGHNPPLWPATSAGVATALGTGLATRFLVKRLDPRW